MVGCRSAHEVGHTMGLPHLLDETVRNPDGTVYTPDFMSKDPFILRDLGLVDETNKHLGNLMMPGTEEHYRDKDYLGTKITAAQIIHLYNDYKNGYVNREDMRSGNHPWGTYTTDEHVYKFILTDKQNKTLELRLVR